MDTEAVDWSSVFAASPAPTCLVGRNGRIRVANAAFAGLLSVEPDALAGVPLDAVLSLGDGAAGEGGPGDAARRGVAFLAMGDGEPHGVPCAVADLPGGLRILTVTDTTTEHCLICKVYSSREKFRTAIDDQSELICRLRPDLTITLVNREFAALFDRSPREMIDRNLRDLLPAPTIAGWEDFLANAAPDSPAASSEEPWPHGNGAERWVSWRRCAVFDAHGRLVAVQSVGRDTTRRRRAEEERLRLAAMVRRSPMVGLAWRTEGRLPIDYVTENAGRLRLDRARLLEGGTGLLDLVHPADAPDLAAWVAACPEEGTQRPLTLRLREENGGERWLSVTAWRSGEGRMEAIFVDVTEQRRARLALRERERRFKAIFDHTFEFIGLLTPDGRMIEANATALSFMGIGREATDGKLFWDTPWWAGSDEDRERLKDAVARAAAGEFVRFETAHVSPKGQAMHVDFSLRPIRDEAGTVIFLLPEGRDITHLKETEAALLAAKREAEAANRSKTQFLAVMSHELRTPLNAVLGYSEVMQAGLFGPVGSERYRGYIDAIHSSGRHLLGIIDDILEISRIELGVMDLNEEDAAVPELVARAAQILANRAGEAGVDLQVATPDGLPRLRCDSRRVIQMLVNVGFNGIKFARRGGYVRLEAGRAVDGGLLFLVRDNGIGIAEEDRTRVWEPFGQAGNAHVRKAGGVGLGLAITRALAEAHGGRADLESEPGKGTAVSLRFPAERCRESG